MNISLDNPKDEDRDELYQFYLLAITNTFALNGIDDPEGIVSEVKHQMKTFNSHKDLLFTARINGKIIGTIAYGQMNESVSSNIPEHLLSLKEIKGVYVHRDLQGKGIGSYLWKTLVTELNRKGVDKVCLDSGYKISQGFWKKKIGDPSFFLKDYWGAGEHHLIWVFHIGEILQSN